MLRALVQNTVLALGALLALFLGYSLSFPVLMQAGVACHGYTANVPVPEGYGAAYNVLSAARELLVQVECDSSSATMRAGNGNENAYVYREGYVWQNGSWQRVGLTGAAPVGDTWFRGEANTTLNLVQGTSYAVAFTCLWHENAWKCGCRDRECTRAYWQLQAYTKPSAVMPTANELFQQSGEFVAGYLSLEAAAPGTPLTLYGSGLNREVTLRFGDHIVRPTSVGGTTAAWFTVPNLTPGVYEVDVVQGSDRREFPLYFAITRSGAQPPALVSVSPDRGPAEVEVVLTGMNFSRTGNYIMSTFAVVPNVPSPDGKTLRVKLPSFPRDPELIGSPENKNTGTYWPVGVKVLNENGITPVHVTYLMRL